MGGRILPHDVGRRGGCGVGLGTSVGESEDARRDVILPDALDLGYRDTGVDRGGSHDLGRLGLSCCGCGKQKGEWGPQVLVEVAFLLGRMKSGASAAAWTKSARFVLMISERSSVLLS
jgi:hypothetical protein